MPGNNCYRGLAVFALLELSVSKTTFLPDPNLVTLDAGYDMLHQAQGVAEVVLRSCCPNLFI